MSEEHESYDEIEMGEHESCHIEAREARLNTKVFLKGNQFFEGNQSFEGNQKEQIWLCISVIRCLFLSGCSERLNGASSVRPTDRQRMRLQEVMRKTRSKTEMRVWE